MLARHCCRTAFSRSDASSGQNAKNSTCATCFTAIYYNLTKISNCVASTKIVNKKCTDLNRCYYKDEQLLSTTLCFVTNTINKCANCLECRKFSPKTFYNRFVLKFVGDVIENFTNVLRFFYYQQLVSTIFYCGFILKLFITTIYCVFLSQSFTIHTKILLNSVKLRDCENKFILSKFFERFEWKLFTIPSTNFTKSLKCFHKLWDCQKLTVFDRLELKFVINVIDSVRTVYSSYQKLLLTGIGITSYQKLESTSIASYQELVSDINVIVNNYFEFCAYQKLLSPTFINRLERESGLSWPAIGDDISKQCRTTQGGAPWTTYPRSVWW